MHCLDANVWIYYLDAGLQEHERVRDLVSDVLESEPLFTTTVLRMEVIHYLANQLADSESVVDRFLDVGGTTVAALTDEDARRAAALLHEYSNEGIGGRDASVLVALDRYEVDRLWTHDEALKRVARQRSTLSVFDPVIDER